MLSGVKVLDLTRVLAGPLCTMVLGDLGADVIKVERPETGDETRTWGPPFDGPGRSAYYLSINRNKLGLAADLDQRGRPATDRTAARRCRRRRRQLPSEECSSVADCRRTNWCARRPDSMWCTITGFGPDSDGPGYDFVAQAEGGWMAITGEPTAIR